MAKVLYLCTVKNETNPVPQGWEVSFSTARSIEKERERAFLAVDLRVNSRCGMSSSMRSGLFHVCDEGYCNRSNGDDGLIIRFLRNFRFTATLPNNPRMPASLIRQ